MKKVFKMAIIAVMILCMGLCITTIAPSRSVETAYAAVYQQGSTGSVIKTMQRKLKNWGYYKGAVDGIFGSKTREAVKYFQRKNGLKVDGIVGPKTLSALGISSSGGNSSSSSSNYSDADVALLARLIYGEARGESYVGQVAVGAVVMNRIKSASFPNTMAGVIYQRYAFTAVDDGQINLSPNATARKAAEDAMNGWDPTYGALYYYNPSTATSAWIFTRKTTVTIGRHVFAI
ncbi:MAG: spore cortex-lytic enzyme [Clostridiales bacterium]|nr:spore cortex-lytic enzyme [Clostridiales bacterium]